MSEQRAGSRAPFGSTIDVMSVTEFQEQLRRVARFDVSTAVPNPLGQAVQKIKDNPT